MLDEFGTIGRLSAVAQAYGLMAGLQMIIWAFVQDLVQLKRDYPDEWETFIGNSQAVTFMNVMDHFTAKYLSELCGVTTVERISQTTVEKRQGGFLSSGDPNYSAMADQVFSKPLIQPAEIRAVTRDLGIMIWPYQPIDFRPVLYYNEPFFLERARMDPHFPGMRENKLKLLAARLLPDIKAVQAALEKQGFQVNRGWFGNKVKVTTNRGKELTFSDDAALLTCAHDEMVIYMKNDEAYARKAATEKTVTFPDFWFLPLPNAIK
jgi:type IV secretory pathway TraG/TraD family ATPase VirD4